MKILLCGDINSGKSTLIQKLVSDIGKAPRGYITVRMPEDETGISHVYLYDISSQRPFLRAFRRAASLFWTSWARLRSMRSASKMR